MWMIRILTIVALFHVIAIPSLSQNSNKRKECQLYNEAVNKWNSHDYSEALILFQECINTNTKYNHHLGQACRIIADSYYYGLGVEKSVDNALDLYNNAVIASDSTACVSLAKISINTSFENTIREKAYSILISTANKNDKIAMQLYNMYCQGLVFTQNLQEAYRLLNIAANNRCDEAEYMLGKIYDTQIAFYTHSDATSRSKRELKFNFVPKDIKKAIEYYEQTDRAYSRLAIIFMDGIGVEKDYKKAFNYLWEDIEAYQYLYKEDDETVIDIERADEYWRLSQCYRFGYGVTDNELKADTYAIKAAKLGDERAKKYVKLTGLE